MNDSTPMPLKTTIATHYFWRQVITAVVCIVFSVWGAYDLFVEIPYQTENAAKWEHYDELAAKAETGRLRTAEEREQFASLKIYTEANERETKPAAFDHIVQWMFIACILWVPWCFFQIAKIKKNKHQLDEDGTLHLPGNITWQAEEIKDIDMSRWMAKSVAWVEHVDGHKVKLDAYLYKHLEKVIGHLAHRFYPDAWQTDGSPAPVEPATDENELAENTDTDAASPTDNHEQEEEKVHSG
ncbi:MAG: hypothetical protein ACR2GY_13950 [Phycisphaerales bacterium]